MEMEKEDMNNDRLKKM